MSTLTILSIRDADQTVSATPTSYKVATITLSFSRGMKSVEVPQEGGGVLIQEVEDWFETTTDIILKTGSPDYLKQQIEQYARQYKSDLLLADVTEQNEAAVPTVNDAILNQDFSF